jgi:hypothetical protein
MKALLVLLVAAGFAPALALANAPQICWDSRNPDAAFLLNVEQALHDARIVALQIRKVSGGRSPVYQVVTNTRAVVRVSCDDSGDGDCACGVGN